MRKKGEEISMNNKYINFVNCVALHFMTSGGRENKEQMTIDNSFTCFRKSRVFVCID
jgi:hypothetical protein